MTLKEGCRALYGPYVPQTTEWAKSNTSAPRGVTVDSGSVKAPRAKRERQKRFKAAGWKLTMADGLVCPMCVSGATS